MTGRIDALAPGLYFVATPIGAARDITLRALDILATADVLAAEDTRTLRHLMEIHAVTPGDRPLVAYHDHNGEKVRPRLLAALAAGKSVAYASEAGTPLVADPGYQLARAAIAALTVSGLPSDRFLFAGFPPAAAAARRRWLEDLAGIPATLILYESPKRVQGLLRELRDSLGADRLAAVCRELTKRFEEVSRGSLAELAAVFAERTVKGEIVIVIDRAGVVAADPAEVEARLREALKCHSIRDAAAEVSAALGLPRRQVYQTALRLADGG